MFDQAFCADFLSNLLSTIFGVALGFPIALWLDRMARLRSESERKRETNARVKKILSLLDAELNENQNAINEFHKDVLDNFFPVRLESWNAFSDGGELQWLNDPDLLGSLSTTYATIRQYHFIFEKYVHACCNPSSVGSPERKEKVLNVVIKQGDIAKKQIVLCLRIIKEKLTA
ncbi:MAG: hypothetical protein KF749_10355 [Bacteroidetes bacterium]|nr:hypothetical protein [Bacteroidota bacterium]MCW5895833.1 hypothetical protein [Bacteroidota bacterium]